MRVFATRRGIDRRTTRAHPEPNAKNMGNIVWLASYPKSGNTWMRAFLANLVANRSTPVPLDELGNYCDDEARPELFAAVAGKPSTELTVDEIIELRPKVHALIAANARGSRFVKTHNYAGAVRGHPMHNMTVTAGAIVVVRNPLDVAISMTSHFGLTIDEAIERIGDVRVAGGNDGRFVTQFLTSWSLHVQTWADLASDRILVLRYEDLLEKPAKHFAKAAKLIGIGQDRARIERAVAHAGFANLASMEKQHGFREVSDKATRFFRVGRMNQWREKLTRDQIGAIVAAHREQMTRFKYVPAGY
jgi:hypothetical protein